MLYIHILYIHLGTYYLSYLLPRNSILRERINTLIGRLNQAGLPKLWNQHTIQQLILRKRLLTKQNENKKMIKKDDFVAFKLSDVQTSFYMLLIGLSLSTIIFFHERCCFVALLSQIEKASCKFKHQSYRSFLSDISGKFNPQHKFSSRPSLSHKIKI